MLYGHSSYTDSTSVTASHIMPGPTELQITYTHAPRFRSTEAAALEYLEDHGYVIIANALTKTETSTAMDKLWSYLESLETGIDRSDSDTWGDTRWPTAVHGGILPRDFAGSWHWPIRGTVVHTEHPGGQSGFCCGLGNRGSAG